MIGSSMLAIRAEVKWCSAGTAGPDIAERMALMKDFGIRCVLTT